MTVTILESIVLVPSIYRSGWGIQRMKIGKQSSIQIFLDY